MIVVTNLIFFAIQLTFGHHMHKYTASYLLLLVQDFSFASGILLL